MNHSAMELTLDARAPTAPQIPRALYRIRSWIWAKDAVFDWLIIVAAFWFIASVGFWAVWPLGVLVIGARQHALALLGHDAAHRLAFKKRTLNDVLGNLLIAWPLFVVLGGYRPWHFEHHRHLGTDEDPELHYRALRPYSGPLSWRKICRVFALDLFGFGVSNSVKSR